MTQTATTEKEAKKAALEARTKDMDAREKKLNEGRTGKGLRIFLAMTRGKNPQEIQFEAFDDEQPTTLPETSQEFIKLASVKDDKELLGYLIEGYNSLAYTNASDPIAEYIDASWPEDLQKGFRGAVRSYMSGTKCAVDVAVNLIRPGIEAAAAAVKAAKEQAA